MPPDRDLDRELRDLGPRVEYPPVPDLAGSVRGRLEMEAGGSEAVSRSRSQLWWIAAAALVLLLAVPVVSLALRETGGFSAGGGAAGGVAGGVAESGGRGAADGDPTRLVEEEGPMPAGEEKAREDGAQEARPSTSDESEATSASDGSAQAVCASVEPVIEARPSRGAPGDEFEIRGRQFVAASGACDDTPSKTPSRKVPNSDVSVELRQDGRTWRLGSVKADGRARIFATLKVPAGARPGRAVLHASYEQGNVPSYPYSAETWFLVLDQ